MTGYPWHQDAPSLRISDSEIVVQKACLKMIAIQFPKSRVAAVPNGGKRTVWQQRQVKAEGVSKGFLDLIIIGGDERQFNPPITAFVEIKAGSSTSPEQKEWLQFLTDCGHRCGVFRSDRTLEDALRRWGFR